MSAGAAGVVGAAGLAGPGSLPVLFGLLAVTVGACAISARGAWVRAAAFTVTLGLSGALWQLSLGEPRPVLFAAPSGTVVGYHLDEPRAIYLWVTPTGSAVPAAYELPWSESQAAQLQLAAEQAEKHGQALRVGRAGPAGRVHGRPGRMSAAAGEVRFYPERERPLPAKAVAGS
jgi:hypothetical protein